MIPRLTLQFLIIVLPVSILAARAVSDTDNTLVVGAVQFAVSESVYQSIDSFRDAINTSLDRVEDASGSEILDLVVFPEYTSTFLGLSLMNQREIQGIINDPAGHRELAVEAVLAVEKNMVKTLAGNRP